MRYEEEQRWQFQPFHVKVYRWFRYIFPAWFVLAWKVMLWLLQGAPRCDLSEEGDEWVMGRWRTLGLIKSCTLGIAECNAGHWYTTEEVMSNLEEKHFVKVDEDGCL